MINKNKQIKIQIALLVILLFGMGTGEVWGQSSTTVKHWEGAFHKVGDVLPNGMQKTNTHRTTVYIKPGESKTLKTPVNDLGATPHSYSRWYNYDDDGAGTSPFTTSYNYANGCVDYGSGENIKKNIIFKAPSDFNQQAVAVDVSAYTDWVSGTYITTEPTLSYRWIFDMVNAEVVAGKIATATADGKYLEDRTVYLPKSRLSGAAANPRVTLEYDRNNYYVKTNAGAVFNGSASGDITYTDESIPVEGGVTEGNYNGWSNSNGIYIDGIRYRSYRTKSYTQTRTSQRMKISGSTSFKVEGTSSNSNRFLYIDYNKDLITVQIECISSNTPQTVTETRTRTVTQYATSRNGGGDIITQEGEWGDYGSESISAGTTTRENKTFNIARYKLVYLDELPKNYTTVENDDADLKDDKKRSLSHLNDNFILINKLDFDYDTHPVTKENNVWLVPLQWDYCSYGFASAWMYLIGKRNMPDFCAPSQNEYGFVKSTGVTGISANSTNYSVTIANPKDNTSRSGNYQYKWWNNSNIVYDRLHYETRGKNDGYFMYIDASDTPGTIAKLPLENKLCAGTKLIVSAGVCSMTKSGSQADLNFIFKGIDADGNEVELNRYTTGDLPLVDGSSNSSATKNPWYQIYYSFDYQSEVEYDRYILQIDNNALSTTGGDYAVDDIRVYRSKPTVQANQILLPCGDATASAKIKIQIGYDKLIEMLNASTESEFEVKYQFMDADKIAIKGYNYHEGAETAETPFTDYGSIWIKTDKNDMESWEAGTDLDASFELLPTATGDKVYAKLEYIENDPQGQYYYIVFKTPNNSVLKYNYTYYTTVANKSGDFETGVCSLISDPFIIEKPGQITVDGAAVIDGKGICFGSPITMRAELLDRINHEPIDPCSFDWFFGEGFGDISAALSHYRMDNAYPSAVGDTEQELQASKGSFTQEDHAILKEATDNHKLYLNRAEIVRRVMPGQTVLAKPIEGSTGKKDNPDFNICNDVIQLNTSGESAMPDVEIGQGLRTQVVRMELEQMRNLTGDASHTLWIPVYEFTNSDGDKRYQIVQSEDNLYEDTREGIVYLCGTNDPHYKGIDFGEVLLPQVARLKTIQVGLSGERYLVFSFNEEDEEFPATEDGFPMKEGFTYSLMFFYNEENNGSGTVEYAVCNGMTSLDFCIVPRYLTWTGKKGDNWNNDGNWKRSTKEELYKTAGDAYTDYTGEDLEQARGFVPMHNSLATIANTATAPWLYKLNKRENGSLDIAANTNHPAAADADSTDYKANAPTTEIEYELEVWNGTDAAITSLTARSNTYAGALFKGNSCGEIFFRTGAETRNTQYLTYEKAHVEFELTNNRWYMLASPLQGVVAGDMYIPTAGGRQETEAFKDIEYQQGAINNRFDPAVYQRNWSTDNAENFRPAVGSYNVRKVGDWSGTYNRVDEIYNEGRGFSIRPIYFEDATDGSKEIKEGHQTLFRLPKADIRYEYYEYGSDEIKDSGKGWNANAARLAANGRLALTPGKETVETELKNNHGGGGELFLAGNPFMATLDINKFLDEHQSTSKQSKQLKREYILLTDRGQCYFTWNEETQLWESSIPEIAGGTVAPLQGFFVKRQIRGAEVDATYTPDMTIAKPATGSLLRSAQTRSVDDGTARLYITAERNGLQSHVLIAKRFGADNDYNEKEDVATFIDSNLKEQPTLYSVAGNTVVSINKVDDRKMIPLGIYSENEEDVTLSFSGVDSFSEEVALYDAKTGIRSAISGQTTFTLPGNTQGRYFICLGEMENEESASVVTAYSPDANRLVITSSYGNSLKRARIYNTLGMVIKDLDGLNSTQEEVNIAGGLYIVRIESEKENATVKVIVKD